MKNLSRTYDEQSFAWRMQGGRRNLYGGEGVGFEKEGVGFERGGVGFCGVSSEGVKRGGRHLRSSCWSLFSGVSLLPLLAACNTIKFSTKKGLVSPIIPDLGKEGREYDTTHNPENMIKVTSGTPQNDTVTVGLLPRDFGGSKVESSFGDGDDKIIAIGRTLPNQYKSSDLVDVAGTSVDFSEVLYLDQKPSSLGEEVFSTVNGNARSTLVPGDVLKGGSGQDSLYIYGQVEFSFFWQRLAADSSSKFVYSEKVVTLESIENIYVQLGTLKVSGNYFRDMGVQKVQGDGRSILWFHAPLDVGESTRLQQVVVQKSTDSSFTPFQISGNLSLQNYVIDLRTFDIRGFNRIHLEKGVTLVVAFDVNLDGDVVGILKDVAMITGRGILVFEVTGNQKVPDLSHIWISKDVDILIKGEDADSYATRELSRGGSRSIQDSNLLDKEEEGGLFLQLGLNVRGTDSQDTLRGTQGDDKFYGGLGDDELQGRAGDDLLSGGPGRDVLITGEGSDVVEGDTGSLDKDKIADFSFSDRIKILGSYLAANVKAVIRDEQGERHIKVDVDGNGSYDFYMVLLRPTEKEDRERGKSLVYNDLDTYFQAIQLEDGILLVPRQITDGDGNEAPDDGLVIVDGSFVVDENAQGAYVGRVSAVDPDDPKTGNGKMGYRLVEDDGGYYKHFELSKDGSLRLKGTSSFDFETTRVVNLIVEYYDNPAANGDKTDESLVKRQAVKVYVKDLNEAPSFGDFDVPGVLKDDTGRVRVTVDENTTHVLTFPRAIDPDNKGSISYRLEGRNSDLFVLDSLARTISFRVAPNYEAQSGTVYEVRLVATDYHGLETSQELRVDVADVQEAPEEVSPLKTQWIILENAGSYDKILGIENIFEDPEYEHLRESKDKGTLTYRYSLEGGGTLSWLSQPTRQDTDVGDVYGMKANIGALISLYGTSNVRREFRIVVEAEDESGLVGRSSFLLVVSNNKPPVFNPDKVDIFSSHLQENGSDSNREIAWTEAVPDFLKGAVDPEDQAVKIQTLLPRMNVDGTHMQDANGNYLYFQRYWGKYGYLEVRDVDMVLGRAGGKKPNSQEYSYKLISDAADLLSARYGFRDALSKVRLEGGDKTLGVEGVNRYLLSPEEEARKIQEVFENINSLREGEVGLESLFVDIADYGIAGDGENPSFDSRSIVLRVTGKNDAPKVEGVINISVFEPGESFNLGTSDPSSLYTGGVSALMENVRDIDKGDTLRLGTGSGGVETIPLNNFGTFTYYTDGRFTFLADHRSKSTVDSLSEGQKLVSTFRFQVEDSGGGAVTNELRVTVVGRNDAPVFDEEVLKTLEVGGNREEDGLRFSTFSHHTFDLPTGTFLDVDKNDELTYSYQAFKLVTSVGQVGATRVEVDISNWFFIDPRTGKVTITNPDAGTGSELIYEVKIFASDGRARAEGTLDFVVYANTPPDPGTSLTNPLDTDFGRAASDLTPADYEAWQRGGAAKHIITDSAFNFLDGIADNTAQIKDDPVSLGKNAQTEQRIGKIFIVAGTYKGKYGTLEIGDMTGTGRGSRQEFVYTLDYESFATNQLGKGEKARDVIKIRVRDLGGRESDHWISMAVEGVNDAPRETEVNVYVVSENNKSPPYKDALEKVVDDDGDSTYVWSFQLQGKDSTRKVFNGTVGTSETLVVEGLYGRLEIARSVDTGGVYSYQMRYYVDENKIAVERLTENQSLLENFVFRVGDRFLDTDADAYGSDHRVQVLISGENDEATILSVPLQVVQVGKEAGMDLNAYVRDVDSTKIYEIKEVKKNGVVVATPSFVTLSGVGGAGDAFTTNNRVTFLGTGADVGTYEIVFGFRDTDSFSSAFTKEVSVRVKVVALIDTTVIPDFNLSSVEVKEGNELTTTDYVVTDVATHLPANYVLQEGFYRGTYGYVSVVLDGGGTVTMTYHLDNVNKRTDALGEGISRLDEFYIDVVEKALVDAGGGDDAPRLPVLFKISVEGTNDAPFVKGTLGANLNLTTGSTRIVIEKSTILRTVDDVDEGHSLSFDVTGLGTRREGLYGYLEDHGSGYRYRVDVATDTDPKRVRRVKALKEGETATDSFVFEVSDGKGGVVNQTLVMTVTGKNDAPELLRGDKKVLILRFLRGQGEQTKDLTGDYVYDPEGDEIVYRLVGEFRDSKGNAVEVSNISFDEDLGRVKVSPFAEVGVYTARVLISNPLRDPISDDGNEIQVVITATSDSRLDLEDADIERTIGENDESVPTFSIGKSILVESGGTGYDPQPVSVTSGVGLYGTYTIDRDTGEFSYTLNRNNAAVNGLKAGEKLENELITYTVRDDFGSLDTRKIKVVIEGANDKPEIDVGGAVGTHLLLNGPGGRLFSLANLDIRDPESTGGSFAGGKLVVSFKSSDSLFTRKLAIVDSSRYVVTGNDTSLLEIEFLAGSTIADVVTALKTIVFSVTGNLVEGRAGHIFNVSEARYRGSFVEVKVEDPGALESDSKRYDVNFLLRGFNQTEFRVLGIGSKLVGDLVIGFDGGVNEAPRFDVRLLSADSPFRVVAVDEDNDGVVDKYQLVNRDLGGTEYIVRELKSGGALKAGALKLQVENLDAGGTLLRFPDGSAVRDEKEFSVEYEAFTGSYILGTEEVDALGNTKSDADIADGVDDLSLVSGNLDGSTIYTGGGNDDLTGYDSTTMLKVGGSADDLFRLGNEIYLGAGNDKVFGGDGGDRLYGGSGNDEIRGGRGNDDLIGGRGEDKFLWLHDGASTAAVLNDVSKDFDNRSGVFGTMSVDRVFGFSVSDGDKIDLTGLTFKKWDPAGGAGGTGAYVDFLAADRVLMGSFVRIIPGLGNVPTKIEINLQGDGSTRDELVDLVIEFYVGDQAGGVLTPDLLVPSLGVDILLPDVLVYATLSLSLVTALPDKDNLNRLETREIEARVTLSDLLFASPDPNNLTMEIQGLDKDLFRLEKVGTGYKIVFDAVDTVESVREDYLLSVKAVQGVAGGGGVLETYGTLSLKLPTMPTGYSLGTGVGDRILTLELPVERTGAPRYLLFDGDDVFGTGYLGSSSVVSLNNRIYGGSGSDSIVVGDGSDDVYGGSGADTVWGGLGADKIWGGRGDDLLISGGGGDVIEGGRGDDTVVVSSLVWERSGGGEEVLRTLQSTDGYVEVLLGEGLDVVKFERGGPIRLDIKDETFSVGDKIDLTNYLLLPQQGSGGYKANFASYVQVKEEGGFVKIYIDKEGRGHFHSQLTTVAGEKPYVADVEIKMEGSISTGGTIQDKSGKDLALRLDLGDVASLQGLDLSDVVADSSFQVVSAYIRNTSANDYGLFLSFGRDVVIGDSDDWSWKFSLSRKSGAFVRDFSYTGGTPSEVFSQGTVVDELPSIVEGGRTLFWGFSHTGPISKADALKLKVDMLQKSGGSYVTKGVEGLRVEWLDVNEVSFDVSPVRVTWKDGETGSWDIRASAGGLDLDYKILGSYGHLFEYDEGDRKVKVKASVDVSTAFSSLPREMHLTLLVSNPLAGEKRHDFVIERGRPATPSEEEEGDLWGISSLWVEEGMI